MQIILETRRLSAQAPLHVWGSAPAVWNAAPVSLGGSGMLRFPLCVLNTHGMLAWHSVEVISDEGRCWAILDLTMENLNITQNESGPNKIHFEGIIECSHFQELSVGIIQLILESRHTDKITIVLHNAIQFLQTI